MEITLQGDSGSWSDSKNGSNPVKWIFLLLLVMGIIITGTLACDHAIRRHGEEVKERAEACLGSVNSYTMLNRSNGRWATFCLSDDGKWYVIIYNKLSEMLENGKNKIDEITSFPRKTATCAKDVIDYLDGQGYKFP